MKTLVVFLFLIPLLSVAGHWGPWWSIILPAILIGLLMRGWLRTFMAAGLAGFILWFGLALFQSAQTKGRVATRISGVFGLPHPALSVALTGFMGAMLVAAGAATGQSARRLLRD